MQRKKSKERLTEDETQRVARYFRLLGEPMRLRILKFIAGKSRTVTEIVEEMGATQTNISKHLALLATGGIVSRSKVGLFVYYKLADPLALKLCRQVKEKSSPKG